MNEIQNVEETFVEFAPSGNLEVSCRYLHMMLEVKTPYHKWVPRMIEYGFVEGADFRVTDKNVHNSNGGRQKMTDHILTLSMAKEIAMLQRNEIGQQIRRKLIQIEEEWNAPDKVMARALLMADRKIKALEEKERLNAPKVAYADYATASKDSVLIRDFAHGLPKEGIKMGEHQLYATLVKHKVLIKKSNGYDIYQRYANLGYFERPPRALPTSAGQAPKIRFTVYITAKGQVWLLNKLKEWYTETATQLELAF